MVWLLTGIWHGASWNFVFWGLYYGILLLAEKFIFGRYLTKLPALFQHIYCMFFVMIGWNLFAFDDMGNGIKFLKSLFGFYGQTFLNEDTVYLLYNHMVLLILCILGSTRLPKKAGKWIEKRLENRVVLQSATQNMFYAVVFLLSVAWLVDATFNPFLYFRF